MKAARKDSSVAASLPSFSAALPRFRSGRDTPRAFLERCIDTLTAREPKVRAFKTLALDAARAAADASTERYRRGEPLSPVDGCPIGIKDIMDTRDMPTQMGSPAFAGWQPSYDAACVQALRDGGAILPGKTVTTAFACGMSNETTNPLDEQRTPGGSSSGSAAAVGAGMLPAALGTQTQGSLLRPASFCGIVGFKPTWGTLSMQGVHPISATHDHLGVLASTLEDTWRIASHLAVAQGHPACPPLQRASPGLPRAVAPKRLLWLRTEAWPREVDAATASAFDALMQRFAAAGVDVQDASGNAAAAALEACLTPAFADRCLGITAYEMRWPYRQYVERHGALIEKRVHDRMVQAFSMTPADYADRLAGRAAMQRRVAALMRGFDGIVTLSASGPAPLGLSATGSRSFLVYATFLGLPAFSLPLMQVDGLPVGLQFIGRHGRDGDLCARARWMMQSR
ncbi:MAG: amidase [Burkholderiales bacterium]|nr:amidase [Burkholderiales bacterium]